MPDPRPLGNVASNILETLTDWNWEDIDRYSDICLAAAAKDWKLVAKLAQEGVHCNAVAVKAGEKAVSGNLVKADLVLMDAKAAQRKKGGA